MKAISLRLDNQLSRQFDDACRHLGYKKNTIITRMILSFVTHKNKISLKTAQKKKKSSADPFLSVIGSLSPDEALISIEDDIDKLVYDL